MILADKIILLRKKNGWSQEQLAEQLNISRQSVSKWESGISVPDLDKIIKMSQLMGVSTDYLLKDEVEEIEYRGTEGNSEKTYDEEEKRIVSLEEANAFMDLTEEASKRNAFSVFLLIISPVCLILLGGVAGYGDSGISEDMAGGIGLAVLLILVAIGVANLILTGMKLSKYEYLEKEKITLQYGVQGVVEKKKEEFAPRHRGCITVGVLFFILGVIPLLVAGTLNKGELIYICFTGLLLFFIACGVCVIAWSSQIQESYEKLLQEGDYTREKKEVKKQIGFVPGIYWCIVAAIYLAVSLPTNDWNRTWVIWPVAGVLFAALWGIMELVLSMRKKR